MADYYRWRISDLKIALTDIKEKYISIGKKYDSLVVLRNQITAAIKESEDEISRLGQKSAKLKKEYQLISVGIDHKKFDVYNLDATAEIIDFISLRTETLNLPNVDSSDDPIQQLKESFVAQQIYIHSFIDKKQKKQQKKKHLDLIKQDSVSVDTHQEMSKSKVVNQDNIESFVELLSQNLELNKISQFIISDQLNNLKKNYHNLEKLYIKVRSSYETKLFGKDIKESLESFHLINPETEEKVKVLQSDHVKEFISKEKLKPENNGTSIEKLLFIASDHFQISLEATKFRYYYKSSKLAKHRN